MKAIMRNNYLWLSPLILLLWGVFSLIYIPIIPIASGFGWDGIFYGKIALNFQNMVGNINTYGSGRIFPAVLIHYILLIFKLPLVLKLALLSFRIYYLIILTASALIWVNIANLLKLNSTNSWVGFIGIFITYPVLNWYFYYPALTDGTTLFISLLYIKCYLKPNYILLFLAGVISFFSWPTGILMFFSIFIYGKKENIYWGFKKKALPRLATIFLLLLPLLLLIFVFANFVTISSLVIQYDLKGIIFGKIGSYNNGIEYNWIRLLSSILLIIYLLWIYWYLLKDFDFKRFFKLHLEKEIVMKIIVAVIFLLVLVLLKKSLSNPSLPTVRALQDYAYPVITLSTRFPLQFIVSHVVFWGPSIFLFIFFFNRFINYLKSTNLAIMVGFLFTIIFTINSESRAITNFYPFIIFIMVQIIDFSKLKHLKLFMISFVLISLFYSKIWLPVTLPETIYPDAPYHNLDKFPLQWYFMNFGPWMNFDMYLLHFLSVIILGGFIYLTIKEKITLPTIRLSQV